MKRIVIAAVAIGIWLATGGCGSTEQNTYTTTDPDRPLLGKWQMENVYRNGLDVTDQPQFDPNDNRWIAFAKDGTFKSDGDPYGPNGGKYYLPGDERLIIDSDIGSDDDSEWRYRIIADTMRWRGLGSDFAKEFELVYIRAVE